MIASAAAGPILPALQPAGAAPANVSQQNNAALAMLQQVAAQQSANFSGSELVEILAALAPIANAMPADAPGNGLGELLTELASKRAAGPAVLVVVQAPGGGSMAAALTPDELAAALASDDPNVLGSITTNGRTTYFRDALLEAVTAKAYATAIASSSTKDQVAQAISEMLRQASADPDPADAASTAGKATQVANAVGKDGARASILVFPGPAGTAPAGDAGMLLDALV
jgi:hypothetical protein